MATGHARDYARVAANYAKRVVGGRETAGQFERLACERFLADLEQSKKEKRKKPENRVFWFDRWCANDACDFLEKLQHVKGRWDNPYIVLEPPQIFIVVNLFGFRVVRRGLDVRRFTDAYIEVARKNAKSTLLAGIQLYCLCCEDELGPEIYSAATTGAQARIVFDVAKAMISKDADLREAFALEVLANSIVCNLNGGFWHPINSKASTQDGLNPHGAGIDELHAHKDRSLHDVIKSAMGARTGPLFVRISTAGYIIDGVCYEQRQLVSKVLQGVIRLDHYFGIIFTIDRDDDPFDEKVWRKANPLLGVSVTIEDMRAYAEEAKASPQTEGEFKTKRLNMWLNAASALIPMAQWDACEDKDMRLEDFKGCEFRLGGDLADFDDIASLVLAVEKDGVEHWFDFHFLPKELVKERAHTVTDHYLAWAKQGYLILTDGDWIDEAHIERFIRDLMDTYGLIASEEPKVRLDQYGSAIAMAGRLVNDGYPVEIYKKTAANYTNPTKQLLARLKVRRFKHTGNPCLRWMASNVVGDFRTDGSVLPKKETKNSKNKIDGIDAGLQALSFLSEANAEESVYTTRGALVL